MKAYQIFKLHLFLLFCSIQLALVIAFNYQLVEANELFNIIVTCPLILIWLLFWLSNFFDSLKKMFFFLCLVVVSWFSVFFTVIFLTRFINIVPVTYIIIGLTGIAMVFGTYRLHKFIFLSEYLDNMQKNEKVSINRFYTFLNILLFTLSRGFLIHICIQSLLFGINLGTPILSQFDGMYFPSILTFVLLSSFYENIVTGSLLLITSIPYIIYCLQYLHVISYNSIDWSFWFFSMSDRYQVRYTPILLIVSSLLILLLGLNIHITWKNRKKLQQIESIRIQKLEEYLIPEKKKQNSLQLQLWFARLLILVGIGYFLVITIYVFYFS